jgi:uncharacterized protein YutE (UPF0331/DUF86 family)
MKKIDDIIINKTESIRKCIDRAREDYFSGKEDFFNDFTRQDSSILNIQRACEQAIDLANHVVKLLKAGVPNESRDSFEFLFREKIITEDLAEKLKRMIGFRNVAIHQYQELNVNILVSVIEKNLDDLLEFAQVILKQHDQIIIQN